MAISGHRTESVYRRYDIVSQADFETAKERLTDYAKMGIKIVITPKRENRA